MNHYNKHKITITKHCIERMNERLYTNKFGDIEQFIERKVKSSDWIKHNWNKTQRYIQVGKYSYLVIKIYSEEIKVLTFLEHARHKELYETFVVRGNQKIQEREKLCQ